MGAGKGEWGGWGGEGADRWMGGVGEGAGGRWVGWALAGLVVAFALL